MIAKNFEMMQDYFKQQNITHSTLADVMDYSYYVAFD